MMTSEYRGSMYAVLSGFLYGFLGYFGINAINGHLSPSTMLFWRFFIASIVILVVLFPKLKKPADTYKQMMSVFCSGVFYYGFSTWLYFLACQHISSGLSMVIFFTYPVMVMLLNFFMYRQAIPKAYYLAIFIILIGMLFLTKTSEFSFNLRGAALAIASGFFYACYLVASKRNSLSPNMSTLMVCLGCTATTLVISLGNHSFLIPTSSMVWFYLLGIAIIATAMPILLMLYGLQYISSEKASILSVLEPVFVVVFGVLLLGEPLHLWGAVGIILILAGALITLLSQKINLRWLNMFSLRRREVRE